MVSVVVPVYDTKRYLKRSLDALVGQTISHSDLEIVLVDDGSTDGSGEICDEYNSETNETGYDHLFNQSKLQNLIIKYVK